jgi:cell division septation protein DedD
MSGGGLTKIRQALWVGAGVALLSLLVVAGSWLFSPRPEPGTPDGAPFQIPEESVRRGSFRPEESSGTAQRFTPEPGARTAPPPAGPTSGSKTTVEPLDDQPAEFPPASAPPKPSPPVPSPPRPSVSPPEAKTESPKPAAPASPPASAPQGAFGVQVGAFGSAPNTEKARKKLESMGYSVALVRSGDATKVIARGFPDRTSAERALQSIRDGGYPGAFVLPLEQR